MTTCAFCEGPTFTNGWTNPELCEQHLDLALIRARMNRTGIRFSIGSIQRYLVYAAMEGFTFSFTADQAPELVDQMQVEDYRLALGTPEGEALEPLIDPDRISLNDHLALPKGRRWSRLASEPPCYAWPRKGPGQRR